MAVVDTLEIQIVDNAKEAASHMDQLAQSMNRVGKAKSAPQALREVADETVHVAEGTRQSSERLGTLTERLKEVGAKTKVFFGKLGDSSKKAEKHTSGLASSLGRFVKYRLFFIAFSQLSSALSEGTSNLYQYSKALGGTFAKSMDMASSNALLLKNSLATALAPVVNSLIGVFTQLANAIASALNWLAQLFALLGGSFTYTKAIRGTNDYASAAGGAAAANKNLLASFDELNVLQTNSGGGGGGGGMNFGDMFEEADVDISRFGWIKSIGLDFQSIFEVVKGIGTQLLAWTISTALINKASNFSGVLGAIATTLASVVMAVITVRLVYNFDKKFLESGKYAYLVGDGIATALGSAIIGGYIKRIAGKGAGQFAASAMLLISAGVSIVALMKDVKANGIDWKKQLPLALLTAIKAAAGGGLIAKGLSLSVVSGAAIGFTLTSSVSILAVLASVKSDESSWKERLGAGLIAAVNAAAAGAMIAKGLALSAVAGAAVGFTLTAAIVLAISLISAKASKAAKANWGDVKLTAEQAKRYAESMFAFDVKARINLIGSSIDNLEKAKSELNSKVEAFNADINMIKLGVGLSSDAYQSMYDQLTGDDGIIAKMQGAINAGNDVIKVSVSLVPPVGTDGEDMSTSLINSLGLASDTLHAGVSKAGAQLGALLLKGTKGKLSSEESAMVAYLSDYFTRMTTAVTGGQLSGAFLGKTSISLSGLTRESFKSVVTEYVALLNDLKKQYTELEIQAFSQANATLSGLIVERDRLIHEGLDTSAIDEQISVLDSKIKSWDIEGSVKAAVSSAIEPTKQAWVDSIKKIFDLNPALFDAQSRVIAAQIDQIAWGRLDVDQSAGKLRSSMDDIFRIAFGDNYQVVKQIGDIIGFTGWDLLSSEMQTQIFNACENAMGSEKAIAVFNQMGYDVSKFVSNGISTGTPEASAAAEALAKGIADPVDNVLEQSQPNGFEIAKQLAMGVTSGIPDAMSSAEALANGVSTPINTLPGEADSAASSIKSALGSLNASMSFSSLTSSLGSLVSSLASTARSVWSHVTDILGNLGKIGGIDMGGGGRKTPSIGGYFKNKYASGGIVPSGQMFIAREAGPELVGTLGGHTAVANNQQIVTGIYEGVKAAMQDAGSSNGGGAMNVNVYLDGKQITAAVEKRQRERGATIYPGGVLSGV